MTDAVKAEIEKLEAILASAEIPLKRKTGATDEQIDAIQQAVGLTFDDDLRAIWKFSNGLGRCFAVVSDELAGCNFPSLEKALQGWRFFEPFDEANPNVYDDSSEDDGRDPRIQRGYLHHRHWFPIAEFNGLSTAVYFDAAPAERGHFGQIIVYQHDHEAVYYVAENFIDFFRKSNELLAKNLTRIFFLDDEFERICRMRGLAELQRQLACGLDVREPNWRRQTLLQKARSDGRTDIVEFLVSHGFAD